MKKFKVGDYVLYKEHYTVFDKEAFEIGKIYQISEISNVHPITEITFEGIEDYFVYPAQIAEVFNATKINKALYPDYKIIIVDNKEFLVENTNDGGKE